jgi:uncharacterized protein (UPF0264 family)
LVSVRSVAEAQAALAGGAGIIDVKEPSRGSLGRASDTAIAEIIRWASGKVPVSAALGELVDRPSFFPEPGLAFTKWGLAGEASKNWHEALRAASAEIAAIDLACCPVAVAYADWQRAQAPAPEDVCAFVCQERWPALLIDTWSKDGSSLLDWLNITELGQLAARCRRSGVRLALAGSLRPEQIPGLLCLEPDWIAVRGAACRGGQRGRSIAESAVRRLAAMLSDPSARTNRAS